MSRRKTTKETKKNNINDYNLTESLNTLETSEMMKQGFLYSINENNITINSDTQLKSEFEKFKKGNAGV